MGKTSLLRFFVLLQHPSAVILKGFSRSEKTVQDLPFSIDKGQSEYEVWGNRFESNYLTQFAPCVKFNFES